VAEHLASILTGVSGGDMVVAEALAAEASSTGGGVHRGPSRLPHGGTRRDLLPLSPGTALSGATATPLVVLVPLTRRHKVHGELPHRGAAARSACVRLLPLLGHKQLRLDKVECAAPCRGATGG
jgi:hypothetical protein